MKVILKLQDYFAFFIFSDKFRQKNQKKYVMSNKGDEIWTM